MRYVLNFNVKATEILDPKSGPVQRRIIFKKTNGNPFLPGTTTLVRGITEDAPDSVSFFPRNVGTRRYGATLSQRLARAAGVKGSQRYVLKNAGNGWHWLVPHSRVSKKNPAVSISDPAITVSIID